MKPLRIAQVAPLAAPVTGDHTGSIEQLVWLLTEELVRRGHDVTLAAAGDSQTSAALHAVYPRGYEYDDDLWSCEFHETLHVASVFERAGDFDVIHSHVYHFALPFIRLVRTPVIHNYHVLPDADIARAFGRYPEACLAAISEYQRGLFPGNPHTVVVHHGIDTAAFPFSPEPGDYLLFLGRILPDKGAVEAIRLAREVGMRLVIAGPVDDTTDYFPAQVAPLVDGRQVEYIGPVGLKERNALLAGAAALVYPIQAPEPFGLVVVEAMACGTPVLATGLGAVPELIRDGVTGFYAPDQCSPHAPREGLQCSPHAPREVPHAEREGYTGPREAPHAEREGYTGPREAPHAEREGYTTPSACSYLAGRFEAALALDRRRIRQEALTRFDYRRMVDEYERLYYRQAAARLEGALP